MNLNLIFNYFIFYSPLNAGNKAVLFTNDVRELGVICEQKLWQVSHPVPPANGLCLLLVLIIIPVVENAAVVDQIIVHDSLRRYFHADEAAAVNLLADPGVELFAAVVVARGAHRPDEREYKPGLNEVRKLL